MLVHAQFLSLRATYFYIFCSVLVLPMIHQNADIPCFVGAGETEDDNSYLSWDVKYGEFDGDEDTIDWAATAPRSHMLQGKAGSLALISCGMSSSSDVSNLFSHTLLC